MSERIPKPVVVKDLERQFKKRDALKKTPIGLEHRFHVAAEREPVVKTRLERVDRGDGQSHWQVIVDIEGVRAGARALPPALKGKAIKRKKRTISEIELASQLTGHIPDHLGFSATTA